MHVCMCMYVDIYTFKPLTARGLLYEPSHRQDSTYHSLCYISYGALAETRNSSIFLLIGTYLIIDTLRQITDEPL